MNRTELKRLVLLRDGECVEHKRDPRHACHDIRGALHGPMAMERLTLEHVKPHLAMGIAKLDEPEHCIALCWQTNAQPPTKEQRAWYREYLSSL